MFAERIFDFMNSFHTLPHNEVAYLTVLAEQVDAIVQGRKKAIKMDYFSTPHSTMFTKFGGCLRQSALDFHQVPQDFPPDGRIRSLFSTGDLFEAKIAAQLRCLGKAVFSETYTVLDGRVTVRPDIVTILTDAERDEFAKQYGFLPDTHLVIEIKSMRSRAFEHLQEDGLRANKPHYYDQVQLELAGVGVGAGLIIVVNKDNDEIYEEAVARDDDRVTDLLLDIETVLDSPDPWVFAPPFGLEPVTEFVRGKDKPNHGSIATARHSKNGHIYGWDVETGEKRLPVACSYCPWRQTCWSKDRYTLEERWDSGHLEIIATVEF